VWCIVRREGRGGLALRAAYVNAVSFTCRKVPGEPHEALRIEVESALGRHFVCFVGSGADLHRLRVTTRFTPASAMRIPYLPRDLYPLGPGERSPAHRSATSKPRSAGSTRAWFTSGSTSPRSAARSMSRT
jgi:hypothetical protein